MTHHFLINFFYYLFYQETRSNTQIISEIIFLNTDYVITVINKILS